MFICTRQSLDKLINSDTIEPIGNFMDYCESNCQHWGYCQSYAQLEQRIRVLDGQAGECKCCGEIYNYEDMNEAGYCERCQRAERSRC